MFDRIALHMEYSEEWCVFYPRFDTWLVPPTPRSPGPWLQRLFSHGYEQVGSPSELQRSMCLDCTIKINFSYRYPWMSTRYSPLPLRPSTSLATKNRILVVRRCQSPGKLLASLILHSRHTNQAGLDPFILEVVVTIFPFRRIPTSR